MVYNKWLEIELDRLENENEELKKRISKLVDIKTLKDDLFRAEAMRDYWEIYSSEINDKNKKLIEENKQLKQELFNLYMKHYN